MGRGRTAVWFHDMVTFELLNRAMMRIEGGPGPQDVEATIAHAIRVLVTGIRQGAATAR